MEEKTGRGDGEAGGEEARRKGGEKRRRKGTERGGR
jgi:hypothetical protein